MGTMNGEQLTVGQNFEVKITVDQHDNITYAPSVLNLKKSEKETATWFCGSGNFVVFFPRTPFEDVEIRGKKNQSTDKLAGTIRSNADLGVYHYQVAIVKEDGSVLVNGGCPEIIIRKGK